MSILGKLFPLTPRTENTKELILSIVIYVLIPNIIRILFWFFQWIPVINFLLNIVSIIISIYCIAGIIVSILAYFKKIEL